MIKYSFIFLLLISICFSAYADLATARYFGKTRFDIGCYADIKASNNKVSSLHFYYGGISRAKFYKVEMLQQNSTERFYFGQTWESGRLRAEIRLVDKKNQALIPYLEYKDAELGTLICLNFFPIVQPSN